MKLKLLLGLGSIGILTQLIACQVQDESGLAGDDLILPLPSEESFDLVQPGQDLSGACVTVSFMTLHDDLNGMTATLKNGLSASSTCDLYVEPNERVYSMLLSDIDSCNAKTFIGSNDSDSLKIIDYRENACPNIRLAAEIAVSETIEGVTTEYYGRSSNSATPPPAASAFIGLGGQGRSGAFANILTMIAPASQPRCFGCRAIKIYYDGKTLQMPIGAPLVSKVQIDMSNACAQAVPPLPVDLVSLYRSIDSPMESTYHVWYDGRGQTCDNDLNVSVQLLAKRCMNPSQPQCDELEIRESFDVKLGDLLQLDLYQVSGLPNQAN